MSRSGCCRCRSTTRGWAPPTRVRSTRSSTRWPRTALPVDDRHLGRVPRLHAEGLGEDLDAPDPPTRTVAVEVEHERLRGAVRATVQVHSLAELDHCDPPVTRVRHAVDAHLVAGQLRHQVGDEREVLGLVGVLVAPGAHAHEAVVGETCGERVPVVADDCVEVPLDDTGHRYHPGPDRSTASVSSSRYFARGTSTAPSDARCGVVHWTSSSIAPPPRSRSTSAARAAFPPSVTRWNIDSAANSPPMATPYTPPASTPSVVHASTLCVQPSRCSVVYASTKSSSIQPCGRLGCAHSRITSSNAVSTVISNRRRERRNDLLSRNASRGTIPRGSGDHHATGPPRPTRIGNKPPRYAASSVPGSRSAPTPAISVSSADSAGGSNQDVGGGSIGTVTPQASRLRAIWPTWISSVPA